MHRFARSFLPHFAVGSRPVSSAIYGTVSVVAVIVVGGHESATAGTLLIFASVSMAVIWAVHVYASTLASAGVSGLHWRAALRHALHDELGVLEGAAAPWRSCCSVRSGCSTTIERSCGLSGAGWSC